MRADRWWEMREMRRCERWGDEKERWERSEREMGEMREKEILKEAQWEVLKLKQRCGCRSGESRGKTRKRCRQDFSSLEIQASHIHKCPVRCSKTVNISAQVQSLRCQDSRVLILCLFLFSRWATFRDAVSLRDNQTAIKARGSQLRLERLKSISKSPDFSCNGP